MPRPAATVVRDGLLAMWLSCAAICAAAQERHALVIGNAHYRHVESLRNPLNDAELIAAALGRIGFRVTLLRNATLDEMVRATTEFGRGLRPGGIAFAYFAGHGVQYGGENYLVPVDADVQRPDQLAQRTFPTSRLFAALPADGRTSNIVVLDACRNNPFADRSSAYARALTAAGSAARADVPAGLSQLDHVPGNTLIAFATSPGKVALDGQGRNSPYAEALASLMPDEGLEVTALFQEATLLVKHRTRFEQEPWMNWSLDDKVFFKKRKGNHVIF